MSPNDVGALYHRTLCVFAMLTYLLLAHRSAFCHAALPLHIYSPLSMMLPHLRFLKVSTQTPPPERTLPAILGSGSGSNPTRAYGLRSFSSTPKALDTSLLDLVILVQGREHTESRSPVFIPLNTVISRV